MRARYIGDHPSVTFWGIEFPQWVYVEVDGEVPQRKVANNNHFEVEQAETAEPVTVEPKKRGRPKKVQ